MSALDVLVAVAHAGVILGAYFMGRSRGLSQAAAQLQHLQITIDEAPIFENLASLVQRYKGIASHGAIVYRKKHDYVMIFCADGLMHSVHVAPGNGDMLLELLGLKRKALLKAASASELPRKPGT